MKKIEKERAINLCQEMEKANIAINLVQKITRDVQLFSEEEEKMPPIFSRDVSFKVRAREGYGHGFSNLSIKKLEIRPNLSNNQGASFCFSLMLVFVTENGKTFSFKIARTNNWVQFCPVECKETDIFFIRSGDDVCEFYSEEDFMETMNFCYDSIDSFNNQLEVKLAEHLTYLCRTPITRKTKGEELFPADYLFSGMRIGIYDGNGAKVASAIISRINDKTLDFYPSTRLIEFNNLNSYFPKNTSLAFVSAAGFKEGWYVIVNNNCDINGPIYEIRPE